jgi:hypothetical protein
MHRGKRGKQRRDQLIRANATLVSLNLMPPRVLAGHLFVCFRFEFFNPQVAASNPAPA